MAHTDDTPRETDRATIDADDHADGLAARWDTLADLHEDT